MTTKNEINTSTHRPNSLFTSARAVRVVSYVGHCQILSRLSAAAASDARPTRKIGARGA